MGEDALKRLNKEFGNHLKELEQRCLFIENEKQEVIGRTTTWYGYLSESMEGMGRIHRISIIPSYQGKSYQYVP
ncbi:MAG TPA: hypothetical protein VK115_03095 [Staphylococcus sp.]|nr:hypothetical protein [Staphylococcus sp.]